MPNQKKKSQNQKATARQDISIPFLSLSLSQLNVSFIVAQIASFPEHETVKLSEWNL